MEVAERSMTIQLGVVMDPIESLAVYKDTTVGIMHAAQERGCELRYIQPPDMYSLQGRTHAVMHPLRIEDAEGKTHNWHALGEPEQRPLAALDAVLMRLDPPFDMNYVYSTYLLEAAQSEGLLVINDPRSLRDCNEKYFATQFPECIPPCLISASLVQLRAFYEEHRDCIAKPLDGMGGMDCFRLEQDGHNFYSIMEHLTRRGRVPIVMQRFIPEIAQGDKRLLMVDGEPVDGVVVRLAAQGE